MEMLKLNEIYEGNSLEVLKEVDTNSVDAIISDPPYGLNFMNKPWDSLPSVDILKECNRVLKAGAFAMWFMTPRQDSQMEFTFRLKEAGFNINFTSLAWIYASGFPKAGNAAKIIDKRLGIEREKTGEIKKHAQKGVAVAEERTVVGAGSFGEARTEELTKATSPEAKALDGSYLGFQPKPAFEPIIVSMKPIETKTYVEQALKNMHGITWLDNCRVPYDNESPNMGGRANAKMGGEGYGFKIEGRPIYVPKPRGSLNSSSESKWGYKELVDIGSPKGRFPANVIVSDDAIDTGNITKAGEYKGEGSKQGGIWHKSMGLPAGQEYGDEGDFSRYFSLDAWWEQKIKELPKEVQKTFPFLITPKASKSEREEGLEQREAVDVQSQASITEKSDAYQAYKPKRKNIHPSVKPIAICSYLITLTSRENDIILDPFIGSGTTAIAARILNRRFIGIEKEKEYVEIARGRIRDYMNQLKLFEKGASQ